MSGWIKLHRKLLNWEWYSDINTTRLFIHLLLVANRQPKSWRGLVIRRGQILTSRAKLSEETGLTDRQIRTSLTRLKSTSELTIHSTNKETVISLCNYDTYQTCEPSSDQQNDQQDVTQATSNRPTNEQEYKEIKEERSILDQVLINFPILDTPEFRKAWEDKEEHRKERKDKPLRATTMKAKFREFAEWGVEVAIAGIQESISNNWQGVFYPKAHPAKSSQTKNTQKEIDLIYGN